MDTIPSMKLADLKRELRARNLSTTGSKQILADRLMEAMSTEKQVNDDSNLIDDHDDILDEDSMLGEEESDGGSEDNGTADLTISSPTVTVAPISLSSPKKTEAVKRPVPSVKSDQNGSKDGGPPTKKKIILNRQPVPEAAPQILPVATAESIAASKAALENKPPAATVEGVEKAVIKMNDDTPTAAADKLKLREEKFGSVTVTESTAAAAATPVALGAVEEKLKKRAARFGVSASGVAVSGKVSLTAEDEVKLAKRKERFGVPSEEKTDELKLKRAERFGGGEKNAKPTEKEKPADVENKKKLRAARFSAAL